MKAAWYERLGAARDVLQVGELPTPEPEFGEVRVRLHVSGINPADAKRRDGFVGARMDYPLIVPGDDGAGVIDRVGEGVLTSRINERVWVYEAQWGRPFGTAAEYIVLPSNQAVHLPDHIDFVKGACLGVPTITAHYAVFADGSVKGHQILVVGGAGMVGQSAIQLAKWDGATVIATVGSAEQAEIARASGADYVFNYKTEDVVTLVNQITNGNGVNRIVEVALGRNAAMNVQILKTNGVISAFESGAGPEIQIPFYDLMFKVATLRFVFVYQLPIVAKQQAVEDITRALEANALQHTIGRRLPLTAIVSAHELAEQGGVLGKILIDLV